VRESHVKAQFVCAQIRVEKKERHGRADNWTDLVVQR